MKKINFNMFKSLKFKCENLWMFLGGLFGSLLVVLIDQITKYSALNTIEHVILKTNGVHTHIRKTAFFNLVLVWNRGISFGVFNHSSVFVTTILSLIIGAIIIFILYNLFRSKNFIQTFCFSLVLGGAIGNIIDRIIFGAVVDFIDIHLGKWHWPAFNVADSCICVGIGLYLIYDIFYAKKDN